MRNPMIKWMIGIGAGLALVVGIGWAGTVLTPNPKADANTARFRQIYNETGGDFRRLTPEQAAWVLKARPDLAGAVKHAAAERERIAHPVTFQDHVDAIMYRTKGRLDLVTPQERAYLRSHSKHGY